MVDGLLVATRADASPRLLWLSALGGLLCDGIVYIAYRCSCEWHRSRVGPARHRQIGIALGAQRPGTSGVASRNVSDRERLVQAREALGGSFGGEVSSSQAMPLRWPKLIVGNASPKLEHQVMKLFAACAIEPGDQIFASGLAMPDEILQRAFTTVFFISGFLQELRGCGLDGSTARPWPAAARPRR